MIPAKKIPVGTKVVALQLADGNMAVKMNAFNEQEERLYAVYSKDFIYQEELLTLNKVIDRK